MQAIDLNQAKQELPKLIEQTIKGDDIIITQEGCPVARLVAFTKKINRHRQFGSAKGLIKMADDFNAPLKDFEEYM